MGCKNLIKKTGKYAVGIAGAALGAGVAYAWGNEAFNIIKETYSQGKPIVDFYLAGNLGNVLAGTILSTGSLKIIKDNLKSKILEKRVERR